MWTDKKPETTKAAEPPRPVEQPTPDRASGWLGASLRVKGDITGTEDLLIDGTVDGSIQLEGRKLTVGKAAKVNADVDAKDVLVYGYVKGNVHAKGRVEIKKDGYIVGNLTTAQIMIEDGADFKGTIEIDRGTPKEADKNAPPRAAAAAAGASASTAPKSI